MKKIITSILLVSILYISSGFFYITNAQTPAPVDYKSKCLADSGLGALGDKILGFISGAINSALKFLTFGLFGGGPDPVTDETSQTIAFKADLKNCIRYVSDTLFKAALANFKKRLLDKLTDDVVNWIKNGDDPRFVSDFGGYLKDAANESLGQTAEQLGLGQLCSGSISARLQLQLQSPPPFTQSVNCTLNDIVKNVGNFDRNFRNGGWIGYNEVIKPQNNRWGIELLALDNVSMEQSRKIESAKNEVVGSNGYKSEKWCVEWERFVSDPDGSSYPQTLQRGGPGWLDRYVNPNPAIANIIFGLPPGASSAETDWRCSNEQVTIPGVTVGETAARALNDNDRGAIENADDLTPYISAIFDAAINRLFKEGVEGLRGDSSRTSSIYSDSRTNRPPTNWASSTNPDDQQYGQYGGQFGNASNPIERLKNEIRATIASTTQRMRTATTSLWALILPGGAQTKLVASTTLLVSCENTEIVLVDPITGNPLTGVTCPKTLDVVKKNTDRTTGIQNSINSLNELATPTTGLLAQALAAVNTPNISEITLISILAGVNQAYTQVENIIGNFVPSVVADIREMATSTVNPWLKACRAPGTYSCPN